MTKAARQRGFRRFEQVLQQRYNNFGVRAPTSDAVRESLCSGMEFTHLMATFYLMIGHVCLAGPGCLDNRPVALTDRRHHILLFHCGLFD